MTDTPNPSDIVAQLRDDHKWHWLRTDAVRPFMMEVATIIGQLQRDLAAAEARVAEGKLYMAHLGTCDKLKPMPMQLGIAYVYPIDFTAWIAARSCTCGLEAYILAPPAGSKGAT